MAPMIDFQVHIIIRSGSGSSTQPNDKILKILMEYCRHLRRVPTIYAFTHFITSMLRGGQEALLKQWQKRIKGIVTIYEKPDESSSRESDELASLRRADFEYMWYHKF